MDRNTTTIGLTDTRRHIAAACLVAQVQLAVERAHQHRTKIETLRDQLRAHQALVTEVAKQLTRGDG